MAQSQESFRAEFPDAPLDDRSVIRGYFDRIRAAKDQRSLARHMSSELAAQFERLSMPQSSTTFHALQVEGSSIFIAVSPPPEHINPSLSRHMRRVTINRYYPATTDPNGQPVGQMETSDFFIDLRRQRLSEQHHMQNYTELQDAINLPESAPPTIQVGDTGYQLVENDGYIWQAPQESESIAFPELRLHQLQRYNQIMSQLESYLSQVQPQYVTIGQ